MCTRARVVTLPTSFSGIVGCSTSMAAMYSLYPMMSTFPGSRTASWRHRQSLLVVLNSPAPAYSISSAAPSSPAVYTAA